MRREISVLNERPHFNFFSCSAINGNRKRSRYKIHFLLRKENVPPPSVEQVLDVKETALSKGEGEHMRSTRFEKRWSHRRKHLHGEDYPPQYYFHRWFSPSGSIPHTEWSDIAEKSLAHLPMVHRRLNTRSCKCRCNYHEARSSLDAGRSRLEVGINGKKGITVCFIDLTGWIWVIPLRNVSQKSIGNQLKKPAHYVPPTVILIANLIVIGEQNLHIATNDHIITI